MSGFTNRLDAFRAALTEPARRERNMLIALAVYTVLWTLYAVIAKSSQGLHPDMTEQIAWSRDLALGYIKHPPLASFAVWLWFSVFPVAEWSYYLLAMLMPAIALWIVWRLSADYLDIEKRVIGVALLTLVPFFNFHAIKFNVNTVLLPLWAAATLFFLRSFERRDVLYAALAGVAAAACMLGKYWSVFLIAGLVIAALIDRRRLDYLRSPAPYVTAFAGLLVLSPHIVWLVQHHFVTFSTATEAHPTQPLAESLVRALGYLGGSLGYVAVPVIVTVILARGRPAALADIVWPTEPARRLAAASFWAPLLLPAIVAPLIGADITSLWSMSAWALLPIVLLLPPAVAVRTIDTRRILAIAIALPPIMLIAAPGIAILSQRAGPPPAMAQANLLAQTIEQEWYAMVPLPLRFVGGDSDLAYGVSAYAKDRPRALPGMPQPNAGELKHDGLVLVCFAEDAGCRRAAEEKAKAIGPNRIVLSQLTRNFLRFPGKPQRYEIVLVPPRP